MAAELHVIDDSERGLQALLTVASAVAAASARHGSAEGMVLNGSDMAEEAEEEPMAEHDHDNSGQASSNLRAAKTSATAVTATTDAASPRGSFPGGNAAPTVALVVKDVSGKMGGEAEVRELNLAREWVRRAGRLSAQARTFATVSQAIDHIVASGGVCS